MRTLLSQMFWLLLATIILPLTVLADDAKIKVLLVTGGHEFEQEPFLKVFESDPQLDLCHATQGATGATVYEREDLLSYQIVVLYDMTKEITDRQKARFLSLFDHGIGLLALHHSLVSFQHWPEYERIIGGRYPEADGKSGAVSEAVGYQHDLEVPIVILAKDHPITAGLQNFTIHDEIYWGFRVQPDVTPLLTTTHPRSGKPLAWTRMQNKSRIVFLQLGHDHRAYENPNYRQLVLHSIHWAAKQ